MLNLGHRTNWPANLCRPCNYCIAKWSLGIFAAICAFISIIAPLTIIGLPTDRQRKQANGRLLKELHWLLTKNLLLSSSLADRET